VYVFQAQGPVALFAEKMDMEVIVRFVAVAVAEFVSDAFSGVFKGMDQMGVPENLESAEYVALVDGLQFRLQLRHGKGAVRIVQCTCNHKAVRRSLYSVCFKKMFHQPSNSCMSSLW
jgi:hypothetical protein